MPRRQTGVAWQFLRMLRRRANLGLAAERAWRGHAEAPIFDRGLSLLIRSKVPNYRRSFEESAAVKARMLRYCLSNYSDAAHARPSASFPASISFVTLQLFRSITATFALALQETYATLSSGRTKTS